MNRWQSGCWSIVKFRLMPMAIIAWIFCGYFSENFMQLLAQVGDFALGAGDGSASSSVSPVLPAIMACKGFSSNHCL